MKTQTIINCVFAVAFVGYVVSQPFSTKRFPINPTFDTITCKKWRVVDEDGKARISAGTFADGTASVAWFDKDVKSRITASTSADGLAAVTWRDKDGQSRISAGTLADGNSGVQLRDKDGKRRIDATTFANGTVILPTKDFNPPTMP